MKTFSDLRVGDKIFTINKCIGNYTIQEIQYIDISDKWTLVIKTKPIIGENDVTFRFKYNYVRGSCKILSGSHGLVISDEDFFLEELKVMEYEKDK